jgi:hypothetical protein
VNRTWDARYAVKREEDGRRESAGLGKYVD